MSRTNQYNPAIGSGDNNVKQDSGNNYIKKEIWGLIRQQTTARFELGNFY
jgi:hypothetical protein